MSYLLQNSKIITKKEFYENENIFLEYEKHEIEDHFILSDDENPFFSIYDIALYCKKNYKDDTLFLIAHRYFDSLKNLKVTEFYIFNTVDIFDEALISVISIDYDELVSKQKVVQDNLEVSKNFLNSNSIHIILGDNIKLHEVSEYIKYENTEIELFDNYNYEVKNENLEFKNFNIINSSLISPLLNSVRLIEPSITKYKKYVFISIFVVLSIFFSQGFTDDMFEDMQRDEKRQYEKITRDYNQIKNKYKVQEEKSRDVILNLKLLSKNKIYSKEQ